MDTYQRQMAALLEKHKVKPWLIFALTPVRKSRRGRVDASAATWIVNRFPLAQLPIFMSMFFGLRRLGSCCGGCVGRHVRDCARARILVRNGSSC